MPVPIPRSRTVSKMITFRLRAARTSVSTGWDLITTGLGLGPQRVCVECLFSRHRDPPLTGASVYLDCLFLWQRDWAPYFGATVTACANMAVYPYKQRLQPGNEGSGVCVALFSELLAPTPEVT